MRLPCGRSITPRHAVFQEGFMITMVIEDLPHFCGLMVFVGHAALILLGFFLPLSRT